jgi:hypothetical protein
MLRHRQAPARKISCALPVVLVTADGERVALSGDLTFDSTDPMAVQLSIQAAADRTVTWTFARNLLAAGGREESGTGDVRVRPARTLKGRHLAVTLASPAGTADLELPAHRVTAFLRHTYDAVPAELEADLIDWSAEFGPILGRGGARTDSSSDL